MVLLDEVEKAHPEVFDVLLQVLDDGRLTDGQGRTVDFRNTILILTSNLGQPVPGRPDARAEEQKREQVLEVVRASFKPEFLNRLDDIVVFAALDRDELARIVDIQVDRLRQAARRPAAHPGGHRPAALDWLADDGLRPGVRRPAAAPAGPDRDRRPAGQGDPGGRGPGRRHGPGGRVPADGLIVGAPGRPGRPRRGVGRRCDGPTRCRRAEVGAASRGHGRRVTGRARRRTAAAGPA